MDNPEGRKSPLATSEKHVMIKKRGEDPLAKSSLVGEESLNAESPELAEQSVIASSPVYPSVNDAEPVAPDIENEMTKSEYEVAPETQTWVDVKEDEANPEGVQEEGKPEGATEDGTAPTEGVPEEGQANEETAESTGQQLSGDKGKDRDDEKKDGNRNFKKTDDGDEKEDESSEEKEGAQTEGQATEPNMSSPVVVIVDDKPEQDQPAVVVVVTEIQESKEDGKRQPIVSGPEDFSKEKEETIKLLEKSKHVVIISVDTDDTFAVRVKEPQQVYAYQVGMKAADRLRRVSAMEREQHQESSSKGKTIKSGTFQVSTVDEGTSTDNPYARDVQGCQYEYNPGNDICAWPMNQSTNQYGIYFNSSPVPYMTQFTPGYPNCGPVDGPRNTSSTKK